MAQKKYLVEKRNVLNDIIAREFTLQELRLFSIYLGQINARDLSTRVVRFPLEWFYRIMDLGRVRLEYLESVTRDLLTKVVRVPTKNGYEQFQLFKKCRVDKDPSSGKLFFEIDAHDDALQLMFDFKKDYFKYELWNVLELGSVSQFRMYELLKQYEWRRERIISVSDLKALLGISEREYVRWDNFKARVLHACQKAINEKTDISFTYEIHSRAGRGGKVESLRFNIIKNNEYTSQLNLGEIFGKEAMEEVNQEMDLEQALDTFSLDFVDESLTNADKQSILLAADGDIEIIKKTYEIAKRSSNINNLVGFLISMIKKDMSGELSEPISSQKQNKFVNFTSERSYDYAELERLENEQLMAAAGLDWEHLVQTQLYE